MTSTSRRPAVRAVLGWGAAASLVLTGLAVPAQAQAPAIGHARPVPKEVVAPIPTLNWHSCWDGSVQCTRAVVPLDYDDPNGETTRLFMVRHEATDQANKVGTLFVNPGGPGGPSSQVASDFAHLLGPRVEARYDVVGIDPRGIGRSTSVRCRTTEPFPNYPRNSVPLNRQQAKPLIRVNRYTANACAGDHNAILDHMSTADTARDMDLIRQAMGDEPLNYYGISYGTYLGATYAAMFPDQVGRTIVDGVLDPVAWSTGRDGLGDTLPFSTRLRSGVGAWDALVSAFNECDRVGKARCRFAGESAGKWRRIVTTLKKGPVKVQGGKIFYSDVVGGSLGYLYDRSAYKYLMRLIDSLYRQMFTEQQVAPAKRSVVEGFRSMARKQPGPYGLTARPQVLQRGTAARPTVLSPGFEGVACSDSVNPTDPYAWVGAGALADRQGPWFGRVWTWASGPCAFWPGSSADAFRGPWRVDTANPVLVVGNFHDPATPISGARTLTSLLPGSRMISLNTWGHGALAQSDCVTQRFQRYLVSGRLPVDGLVCQPDKQLFPRR